MNDVVVTIPSLDVKAVTNRREPDIYLNDRQLILWMLECASAADKSELSSDVGVYVRAMAETLLGGKRY